MSDGAVMAWLLIGMVTCGGVIAAAIYFGRENPSSGSRSGKRTVADGSGNTTTDRQGGPMVVTEKPGQTFADMLGKVAKEVGLDESKWREIGEKIDVGKQKGEDQLAKLKIASAGAINFVKDKSGKVKAKLDKLELRRRSAKVRDGFKNLITKWQDRDQAAAEAAYGINVHLPDGKIVKPDAKVLGPSAVVLIHGLDDPGTIWDTLIPELLDDNYIVCEFSYPNDQAVTHSAVSLAEQLRKLRRQGVKKVTLVAHSMGGLVSRELLTRKTLYDGQGKSNETYPDVVRLITVGTPHHGSHMAHLRAVGETGEQIIRTLSGDGLLFGSILDGDGQAKEDLLPDSEFLQSLNKKPHARDVPMTVIAGRVSPVTQKEINDLGKKVDEGLSLDSENGASIRKILGEVVNGVGDGVVTLESSRLSGVKDYVVVEGNHITMLMKILPADEPRAIPIILKRLEEDAKANRNQPTASDSP